MKLEIKTTMEIWRENHIFMDKEHKNKKWVSVNSLKDKLKAGMKAYYKNKKK